MIKLVDTSLPDTHFAEDFVGAKIYANYLAYGTGFSFSTFWVQCCKDTVTAVINKFENTIFIAADSTADITELKDFCEIIGFYFIQADAELLFKMGYENISEYAVLNYENEITPKTETKIPMPNLKTVYDILFFEDISTLIKPSWEGWYADLSHRIRHGAAVAFCDENAALVFSHITDNSAIISGVSVLPKSRKNGIGSKLLSRSIASVSRRNVFACADFKTASFYIKNGFTITKKLGIHTAKEIKYD